MSRQELDNQIDNIDAQTNDDADLFAEEVEDRFNAKIASTVGCAACATGTWSTISSGCSAF